MLLTKSVFDHGLLWCAFLALLMFAVLPARMIYAQSATTAEVSIAPHTHSNPVENRKRLEQYVLTHRGDPQRGRQLFLDKKLNCATCHTIQGEGGRIGPDLSYIGGKFDRPHLVEALLEPSRQIVEGYRTSAVLTNDGLIKSGIVTSRSDSSLTLADGEGRLQEVPLAEIEEIDESDLSIMPEGLVDPLSGEQLADLVSYLETLRAGGRVTPGAGVVAPLTLPTGFTVEVRAKGLDACTALEITPDGRVLICEQSGNLREVENGELVPDPLLTLPVDCYWERGLIGVTVDPQFPAVPHVFLCYVAKEPYPHHRVSRFTLAGNRLLPESEQVLVQGDDQRTLGGTVPAGHQGGALHFGKDGKLYVGIGEQTASEPAQSFETFQGKLLRINRDGSIPADNPLLDKTSGKYQAIWAYGLRNPYTFAFDPNSDAMLINDVGGKFEEINRGIPGGNYGWPTAQHGPADDPNFVDPIHWYPEASICGGAFVPDDSSWPVEYRQRYLFGDYVHGAIYAIDPRNPSRVTTFATGLRRPVDMRFATDGSLYVLLRNAWVVDDKYAPYTGSLVRISPPKKSVRQIELWYGKRQRFGQRGVPQRWVNLLGRVSTDGLKKLTYRLNDSAPRRLSLGLDHFRLASPGDFNAEIDVAELTIGNNVVKFVASYEDGDSLGETVDLEWAPRVETLPLHIDWKDADNINDVAQVVDGHWELTDRGVRIREPYYDRAIAFGDRSWTDYVVETSVTFHGRRMPAFPDGGANVIHAAIATRWPGHDADEHQPHRKWYPLGATAEFMLTEWPENCRWRLLGSQRRTDHAYQQQSRPIRWETCYGLKHRAQTQSDGATQYAVKLWPRDSAEPAHWDLTWTRKRDDVGRGGALVLAHYTDVTFGNISVESCPLGEE